MLDARVAKRRALAERYREAFAHLDTLSIMPEAEWGVSNRWLSVFLLDPHAGRDARDRILAALDEENIEARPVWKPMHLQPLFEDAPMYGGAVSADLFDRGVCLPSGSSLTESEQDRVIDAVSRVTS